jgi:hypothetical protein
MLKVAALSERKQMPVLVSFAKRYNRHDSSVDSICMKCYQTVASADSATELASAEETHVCDLQWAFKSVPVASLQGTF